MVTFISCSNCGTCHTAGMQWMLWQMFKCLPTLTQHASRYANWISGSLPIHGYSLLTIFFLYIIDRQVYSFLNSHAHIFVIINLYVVILIEIFFQTFAHCHNLINKTSYCSKILTLQEQKVTSLYAVSAIFNDQLIKILIKKLHWISKEPYLENACPYILHKGLQESITRNRVKSVLNYYDIAFVFKLVEQSLKYHFLPLFSNASTPIEDTLG